MHEAIVLLDYDNLHLQDSGRKESSSDVEFNLINFMEVIVNSLKIVYPDIREVNLQIYGGWTDENGTLSKRAQWILTHMSKIRTRYFGIRVLPNLALQTRYCQTESLIGMVRTKNAGSKSSLEQKMVDTLIAVDALYFAQNTDSIIVFASDDDDMIPPAFAASKITAEVAILRRKNSSKALNDVACYRNKIQIIPGFE